MKLTTKGDSPVRILLAEDSFLYGIYWSGTDYGWLPAKWSKEGKYHIGLDRECLLDLKYEEQV